MEKILEQTEIIENESQNLNQEENIEVQQENENFKKDEENAETKVETKENLKEEIDYSNKSYENIEKVTTSKGIDFNEIKQEFVNNGCELTDKIIEKYVKAGIPLSEVKEIAQGFKALHDKEMDTIAEVVGGREKLTQTLEWARDNLEADKLQAIREDLSKNPSELMAKAMVTYLHNQMIEKEGIAPQYLSNTTGANMNGDIFKSKAEAIKAMSDSRYNPSCKDYDEAYAKEIDNKLERTNKVNNRPLFE